MKISKSFKSITFIFIGFLFVNNPSTYAELPNNLVIHDKPKKITPKDKTKEPEVTQKAVSK